MLMPTNAQTMLDHGDISSKMSAICLPWKCLIGNHNLNFACGRLHPLGHDIQRGTSAKKDQCDCDSKTNCTLHESSHLANCSNFQRFQLIRLAFSVKPTAFNRSKSMSRPHTPSRHSVGFVVDANGELKCKEILGEIQRFVNWRRSKWKLCQACKNGPGLV